MNEPFLQTNIQKVHYILVNRLLDDGRKHTCPGEAAAIERVCDSRTTLQVREWNNENKTVSQNAISNLTKCGNCDLISTSLPELLIQTMSLVLGVNNPAIDNLVQSSLESKDEDLRLEWISWWKITNIEPTQIDNVHCAHRYNDKIMLF